MNKNAKKWVEALRSGEYAQGLNTLCTPGDDEDRFCCLGVACELYAQENGEAWEDAGHKLVFLGKSSLLPRRVRDWLGLSTGSGFFVDGMSLADMNDQGSTFTEIADLIESEPECLFDA